MRDGVGVHGPLLCEFSLYGINNWTAFELNATANGSITVKFGSTGHAIYGPAAYHIDGLVLTPEPTTFALFASVGLGILTVRPKRR